MEDKDKGAFACVNSESYLQKGLTKREYFAALAMQGYCACVYDTALSEKAIARESVRQADALLAELERTKSE